MTPEELHTQKRNIKVSDMPGLPGAWIDGNGEPHISVPEVLEALGLPGSPADRLEAIKIIEQQLKELGYNPKVRLQPDPLPEN